MNLCTKAAAVVFNVCSLMMPKKPIYSEIQFFMRGKSAIQSLPPFSSFIMAKRPKCGDSLDAGVTPKGFTTQVTGEQLLLLLLGFRIKM
jgi:hypothetical protein